MCTIIKQTHFINISIIKERDKFLHVFDKMKILNNVGHNWGNYVGSTEFAKQI